MKHLLYFTFFLLTNLSVLNAQKPIALTEDSVKFGNRYFPGFWLSIPEVKTEVVKASWIKATEKGTKSKVTVDKNEMTLFGAIIPDVSGGNMNIMSKVIDHDSLTKLFVCVETTRDNFIGKTSDEYDKLSKYLKKFAKGQYVSVVKDQVSTEEGKLRDIEKELKSARKNQLKFEKDIQSSRVRISQENDKIAGINKELEVTDAGVDNITTLLSAMADGEARKTKQAELKDLQKKKKGLIKDINSAENRISKANTSIEDNTKNIELNGDTQKELGENINQQKLVIARFQKKLKTIESY